MSRWICTISAMFMLMLTLPGFAQLDVTDLPQAPPDARHTVQLLGKQIEHLRLRLSQPPGQGFPSSPGDLIIGQNDPNEVVTITGDYTLEGNIIIVNNGTLNLDSANFQLSGDIFISGTGTLNAIGGSFTINQSYAYEHDALVVDNGTFRFDGVEFHSGESWGFTAVDSGRYFLLNSQILGGFITHGFFGDATGLVENCQLPGEFLCFGHNDLQFRNSDWLLLWLVLFDSTTVDIALPGDSLRVGWTFNNSIPGVSGVPYSTSIDSCTNVNWGVISLSGSDATFRDTDFQAVGLMFTVPDSIVVENLTNGSFHSDEVVAVPDRMLHLINTEVQTWNFYPFAHSNVTVQNCVFGELIASDSSQALIVNSLCDGSGGYLGAEGNAMVIVFRSLISTQVIAKETSAMIGVYAAFGGTDIVATDFSIMVLLNTLRLGEPAAIDGGVIFEELLPPVEGFTESELSIPGTARLIAGPNNPIQFAGYTVEYAQAQDSLWHPTDGFHLQPVVNDTLALWNTAGLLPGEYQLKLSLFHNFGDSISVVSPAQLRDPITGVEGGEEETPRRFFLEQNYPNPFNPVTTIAFYLPQVSRITLHVHDITGRKVRTLVNGQMPAGRHQILWNGTDDAGRPVASGVYLYRLQAGDRFVQTRKMVLMR